jgi:protein SCO1/2
MRRKIKNIAIGLLTASAVLFLVNSFPLFAHGKEKHGVPAVTAAKSLPIKPDSTEKKIAPPETTNPTGVSIPMGVDERLGTIIPLDVPFVNEQGASVTLRDLVNGPTVLTFLYYGCADACGTLITGIARVLRTYADKPETAPNIITISVDENEKPADAMKARAMAFESIEKPYPENRWRFLTGPAQSIKKITDATGFRFVKKDGDIDHPLCLIILSPKGKVVRYIMGADFLPMDLNLSLMEANAGTVQPTIARVLRYCFKYNPASRQFVFNVLRVSATVIIALVALFVAYLALSGKRRKAGKGTP